MKDTSGEVCKGREGALRALMSVGGRGQCQGHSSLNAPSELNLPQRIPSLFETPLVPQAEG